MNAMRLLRYIDAVAKTGSLRAAAEQLNVASSALTRRIIELEGELGTPLFERRPRGVIPTAAGGAYLKFVRQALSEHDAALSQIEELKGLRRGNIKLSTIAAVVAEDLPRLISDFQSTYSRITFEVTVSGSDDVVKSVLNDDADCGIAFDSTGGTGFRVIAEARQSFCAVMRNDHPLASAQSLKLSDCAAHPVALADLTWGGRQMLDEQLARSSLFLNSVLQTNSIELLVAYAKQGRGMYFQVRFPNANRAIGQDLVAIPIFEFQRTQRKMLLGVRQDRSLSVIASTFCEFLKERMFATPIGHETPGGTLLHGSPLQRLE